jgi:hypothetical protein
MSDSNVAINDICIRINMINDIRCIMSTCVSPEIMKTVLKGGRRGWSTQMVKHS